ncbi:MAG: hypothetical protein AAF978_04360 [Cyanobacteria bacterium P01_E01_bin.48]
MTPIAAGWFAAPVVAEEWEFFAAGTDSYRHYIDLESIHWGTDDPAIASARFSSNQEIGVYAITLHCDPNSPNYGTYLLNGYPQPLYLETVVESARSILCLSPCSQFTPHASTFIPERAIQLADDFWAERHCPSPTPAPSISSREL